MTESGFRLDVQGVRGFALVLVLAAHAEIPFMDGGFVALDVFYVLSGFLITGLIMGEVKKRGTVSLLGFYARRARRLLPLAATVLGVILLGSVLLFGSVRAYRTSGDVIAASLYFVNWRFIAQSVDYFQFNGPDISPVQHYWSLSVEEQFYLIWPVLILGFLLLAVRFGWTRRALLWLIVLPLGLASLAYSIIYTPQDPNAAYFSTFCRVWQIAAGCALALLLPRAISLRRWISTTLTVAGIATLIACTVLLSNDLPYPGWRGLFPVLASVAIIVAGTATIASAPIRLLSTGPFQYLGKISYAWYLWHWPAIVFAVALFGQMGTLGKVAVTLAAWIPTTISHHLIEERFRRSRTLAKRPRRAMAIGFACTGTAIVAALLIGVLQPTIPTATGEVAGSRAVDQGQTLQRKVDRIQPDPRKAESDRGAAFDHCHLKGTPRTSSPGRACVFGSESSATTIVNIGDSHGLMYSPTAIALGRKLHWRVVNLTRAGCTVATVHYKPDCDEWRENTMRRIEQEKPDVVLVSSGTNDGERYSVIRGGERLTRAQSEPYLERGMARTLRRIKRAGAKPIVIRDIARARNDVVDCVADNPSHLEKCSFQRRRDASRAFDRKGAAMVPGAKAIDPDRALCPSGETCPAVIGDALVYRNSYHLTATFAKTMAPWLRRHLPELPHPASG